MTEFEDVNHDFDVGTTAADIEPGLPVSDLHIVNSRIRESENEYRTKIWMSRPCRRFYAMGLLHEAMAMFQSNETEITWCDDTPGCISETENDSSNDDDDDEDGEPACLPKSQ